MPNLLKLKNLHVIYSQPFVYVGFPGVSVVKNSSANARDTGDAGLVPGSGSSPGEGNGHPLQYSSLKNPMNREAWQL